MTDSKNKTPFLRFGIGRRLILDVLVFSSIITIIGLMFQISLEYKNDMESVETQINQIETSHLKSLSKSLWVSDYDMLAEQLNGILTLPYLQYIEVEKDQRILMAVGGKPASKTMTRSFPLSYLFNNQEVFLGNLNVVISLDPIYDRITRRALSIAGIQGIQIFMVSAFILFISYQLVGRHLFFMASYARTMNLASLERSLHLKKSSSGGQPDELDQLANAINEMRVKLSEGLEQRKKAEQEIQAANNLLRAVMENTTDAIFIKDLEGRYLMANPATCHAIGKPLNDILGRRDKELFPEKSADIISKVDEQVLLTGKTVMFEERLITAYGDSYWLANKSPYYDSEGRLGGLIGISRNITELKLAQKDKQALEDNLRQAHKMEAIGTLAGGIAHDFNNILTIIIGNAELAAIDLPEWNPGRENISAIKVAGLRAKEVVNQLLNFSRKQEQYSRPIRITPVVQETTQLLRASIPSTIDIATHLNGDLGNIKADPSQIHQIILNLCTNATQAMEEKGGRLTIDLTEVTLDDKDARAFEDIRAGRYVQLTVSDTGTGIDEKILKRIFDPYFTTKAVGKGTGMGLAVVHGIVKNHKGAITVDSTPGQGTRFKVLFPVVEDAPMDDTPSNDPFPKGNERILYVDDEEYITAIGNQILSRLGYRVTTCTDPRKALEIFSADPQRFDMVITDMTMPVMTGDKVAEKMLQLRPDLPMIICSGYSEKITQEKAKAIGIKAFLLKPISIGELAASIRQVFDNAKVGLTDPSH